MTSSISSQKQQDCFRKKFQELLTQMGKNFRPDWLCPEDKHLQDHSQDISHFFSEEYKIVDFQEFCEMQNLEIAKSGLGEREKLFYAHKQKIFGNNNSFELDNVSEDIGDTFLSIENSKVNLLDIRTSEPLEKVINIHPFIHLSKDQNDNIYVYTFPDWALSTQQEVLYIIPNYKLIVKAFEISDEIVYRMMGLYWCEIINYWKTIEEYINNTEATEKLYLMDLPIAHLGHNVWNRISGWETLSQLGGLNKVDGYVVWNIGSCFGVIPRMYEEVVSSKKPIFTIDTSHELMRIVVEKNCSLLRIHDLFIREELCDKILSWSKRSVSNEFKTYIQRIRSQHEVVVLLTLRTGNRSWVSQTEGYIRLINRLSKDHERIAFILDGMTQETDVGPPEGWVDKNEEFKIYEKIKEQCSNSATIVRGVNVTMAESLLLSSIADYFIAPSGTGMTKYKWIANKHGVAISNTYVLDLLCKEGAPLRVWDSFRDNIIPAQYLPLEQTRNVGNSFLGIENRSDFEIDWEDLYAAVKILESSIFNDFKSITGIKK